MNSAVPSSSEVYRIVGARIRDERLKRNITQNDLAASVGLTRTSITNIEKGRQKLSLHTLVALASELRVSPVQFVISFEPKTNSEIESLMPSNVSDLVKEWIVTGAAKAPGIEMPR